MGLSAETMVWRLLLRCSAHPSLQARDTESSEHSDQSRHLAYGHCNRSLLSCFGFRRHRIIRMSCMTTFSARICEQERKTKMMQATAMLKQSKSLGTNRYVEFFLQSLILFLNAFVVLEICKNGHVNDDSKSFTQLRWTWFMSMMFVSSFWSDSICCWNVILDQVQHADAKTTDPIVISLFYHRQIISNPKCPSIQQISRTWIPSIFHFIRQLYRPGVVDDFSKFVSILEIGMFWSRYHGLHHECSGWPSRRQDSEQNSGTSLFQGCLNDDMFDYSSDWKLALCFFLMKDIARSERHIKSESGVHTTAVCLLLNESSATLLLHLFFRDTLREGKSLPKGLTVRCVIN